jgi:hypothetical protein
MHGAGERLRVRDTLVSVFVFIAACAVALVNKASILALCAMASTLFVQLLHRGSLKALLLPVSRFWLMFLFIACIHGFLSYGTTIEAFPLVTYEGARLIGVQWLKLFSWLELSFILTHFNFHIVALKLLTRVFPNNQSSLFSGAIALECFPIIVGSVQKKVKSRWRWCARHPVAGMRKSFTFIYREIERLLFAQP